MVVDVFLRDDDVCDITQDFLVFHKLTASLDIPILYAVIPAKLTQTMEDFIRKHDLPIAQQGWTHTNHGSYPQYEFGISRSEQQQREDIQNGYKHLQNQLPDHFLKIFVPPFHGYNETTLNIIQQMGMEISVPGINNSYEVHICLEIFADQPSPITFEEFTKKFVKKLKTNDKIGMCTHHRYVNITELTKILKFLKALQLSGKINLINFGEKYKIAHS